MKKISIKIKKSKLSDYKRLAKSLDIYLKRKLNYDNNNQKLIFSTGYIGSDFVDGFFRLIIEVD